MSKVARRESNDLPAFREDTPRSCAAGRVAYVLKVFPRVSETFVINEVRALETLGETPCVFSLHRNPDGNVPHRILDDLRSPVVYIDDRLSEEDVVGRARKKLAKTLHVAVSARDRILPRKYVRLALAVAEQMEMLGVGHLHAHFASRAAHVAALAAAMTGATYSVTAHAKDIYHEEVDRDVLRWKIERAAFVVTVTDFNVRHLRELVSDRPSDVAKVVRLYNGVDLGRFHVTDVPVQDPSLVVAVGRLVEKKGFHVLLDACRMLTDRGVRLRCELIGDGAERRGLEELSERLSLDGVVRFRGVLSTEQVGERLREASLVVLPCIVGKDGNVDALPTVLLEAMASGRPVVSTALSGIPEIVVDGETGLLVPPNAPEPLADAIAKVLGDRTAATAMGQRGRDRVERLFDLHANVARIRDMFKAKAPVASNP